MMFSRKVSITILLVYVIASVLNVLYLIGQFPEWSLQLGFVAVMISSIIINLRLIAANKKKGIPNKGVINDPINKVFNWLLVGLSLIWCATYILSVFIK